MTVFFWVSYATMWVAVLVLVLAVLGLYRVNGKLLLGNRIGSEPAVGARIPALTAQSTQGERLAIGRPKTGRELVCMVSFGCGTCKTALEGLGGWSEGNATAITRLTVLLIGGTAEAVSDFEAQFIPQGAVVVWDPRWELALQWGCRRVPWALLVGTGGVVLASGQPATWEQFSEFVAN